VCQYNIAVNDINIIEHNCGNKFHSECINNWKKHNISCPICRGCLINT